jgi:hypothetical protein
MFWENIKNYSDKNFKRLTGVELQTFRLMSEIVYDHEDKQIEKKGNNRSRPFKLSVEDQVLMLLMYYREYRTMYHIGETYNLHEANVGKNIRRIEKILKKSKRFDLPGKAQLAGTNHKFEVLIIDATESPIERPKKTSSFTIPGRRRNIQLKPKS